MKMINEVLNISENKIGHLIHEGHLMCKAADICNFTGTDEKTDTWKFLKESERFEIPGPDGIVDLYITESGVYKLIMIGKTLRAEEARDYICEEILPKISK